MQGLLKPIRTESLKEVFINRFEELILSGKISVGQRLPSERELAVQLGVSRPVVHEGLLDLAAKGLVTMIPRVGTIVNDFRKEGSLSLLTSLVNYHQGGLEPHLLGSLLEMRQLFEVESARLAAHHRNREHLSQFTQWNTTTLPVSVNWILNFTTWSRWLPEISSTPCSSPHSNNAI